jgi:hypothetical protein
LGYSIFHVYSSFTTRPLLTMIGIDLFFFNCFIPLVFDVKVVDMFIRTIIDVAPITVGVYVAKKTFLTLT